MNKKENKKTNEISIHRRARTHTGAAYRSMSTSTCTIRFIFLLSDFFFVRFLFIQPFSSFLFNRFYFMFSEEYYITVNQSIFCLSFCYATQSSFGCVCAKETNDQWRSNVCCVPFVLHARHCGDCKIPTATDASIRFICPRCRNVLRYAYENCVYDCVCLCAPMHEVWICSAQHGVVRLHICGALV